MNFNFAFLILVVNGFRYFRRQVPYLERFFRYKARFDTRDGDFMVDYAKNLFRNYYNRLGIGMLEYGISKKKLFRYTEN